jgi:PTS system ascorbate-specific IIB component
MKKIKIMSVCGFGLGSSMVLRMTLDKVLKKHGIKAETFCADEATARGMDYDMVMTSKEMEHLFKGVDKPVIVITRFLSVDEVEERALETIQKLIAEE